MITIYEGDCLKVMPTLPAASVGLILTDLPYGTTYAPWDCPISLEGLWKEWERLAKPGCPIVLTASQPFTSALIMSRPRLFRFEWIWDKVNAANFANANRQPLKSHESVVVFSFGPFTYVPQKKPGPKNHAQGENAGLNVSETRLIRKRVGDDLSGLKFPKTIITFPKHSSQSKLHSAQKPVPLFEYLIRTHSREGDIVLDCAAGSGTTGEAVNNCGRRDAILIDNKPEHVTTMMARLPCSMLVR